LTPTGNVSAEVEGYCDKEENNLKTHVLQTFNIRPAENNSNRRW